MCDSVPPEFSDDQPDLVQVVEDETATLPVKVMANPDEITCEWIFQGEKLVKGNRHDTTSRVTLAGALNTQTDANTRCHMHSE